MRNVTTSRRVDFISATINQKIAYKTAITYGTFTMWGLKSYLESYPRTINVEEQITVQFESDFNVVADAVQVNGDDFLFYSRNMADSNVWELLSDKELNDMGDSSWYAMAYSPSSNLWVYYPTFSDAVKEGERRLEESLTFGILDRFVD